MVEPIGRVHYPTPNPNPNPKPNPNPNPNPVPVPDPDPNSNPKVNAEWVWQSQQAGFFLQEDIFTLTESGHDASAGGGNGGGVISITKVAAYLNHAKDTGSLHLNAYNTYVARFKSRREPLEGQPICLDHVFYILLHGGVKRRFSSCV